MNLARITIAYAAPELQVIEAFDVPAGTRIQDILKLAEVRERFPSAAGCAQTIGIFGRPAAPETLVRDGDRIELYRPLKADPKQARRLRSKRRQRPGKTSCP